MRSASSSGDIGTSPLYALQSVFFVDGGIVHPTDANVYGVVSLVFWTITLIVSIKYVTFVMRADKDGEGGVMALVALVQRTLGPTHRVTAKLVALGAVGAALFFVTAPSRPRSPCSQRWRVSRSAGCTCSRSPWRSSPPSP